MDCKSHGVSFILLAFGGVFAIAGIILLAMGNETGTWIGFILVTFACAMCLAGIIHAAYVFAILRKAQLRAEIM